jgi:magnesium chelatase family protein
VVGVIARAVTFTLSGLEARRIDVEAHLRTQTSPSFAVVGLPDRAVSEARQRVRSAVRSSQYEFPGHELTVNLAPAREKKQGSGFDLAIGLAVLAVSGQAPAERIERVAAAAELGLDGRLRPVAGVLAMAEAAAQLELDCILVAPQNAAEASLVPGIAVAAVADLNQAVGVLEGWAEAEPPAPAEPRPLTAHPDMADVYGQARARRAVEIAAAGGHNLLLCGPPGSGKTMLARRLPGLLPPPDPAESLEISRIHSAAGLLAGGRAMLERPFRAPHHSASVAALVGSAGLRPGEVTLAHGGVLFLDELPEFQRPALEALRLPLEDGEVLISRAAGAVRMPARSLVIAAMNPCPCGRHGDPDRPCICPPQRVDAYRARVSGPLLDRFDLRVDVPRADAHGAAGEATAAVASRVAGARERLDGLPPSVSDGAGRLLRRAVDQRYLSARGAARSTRVARTIAALAGADAVSEEHMAEALSYRSGAGR